MKKKNHNQKMKRTIFAIPSSFFSLFIEFASHYSVGKNTTTTPRKILVQIDCIDLLRGKNRVECFVRNDGFFCLSNLINHTSGCHPAIFGSLYLILSSAKYIYVLIYVEFDKVSKLKSILFLRVSDTVVVLFLLLKHTRKLA